MKSEKAIQAETLIAVTALPGIMAWRENSGFAWVGEEVRAATGASIRLEPGMKILRNARPLRAGVPGIADIMGVAKGKAFALECKVATGAQEVSQRRFERAFVAKGGLYTVVKDPDEAVRFLTASIMGGRL